MNLQVLQNTDTDHSPRRHGSMLSANLNLDSLLHEWRFWWQRFTWFRVYVAYNKPYTLNPMIAVLPSPQELPRI